MISRFLALYNNVSSAELTRSIWKMLGPIATTSRLTPIHQMSLAVLSHAACASMSTTTTTCDRGDRYGPMEWAQQDSKHNCNRPSGFTTANSKYWLLSTELYPGSRIVPGITLFNTLAVQYVQYKHDIESYQHKKSGVEFVALFQDRLLFSNDNIWKMSLL